MTPSQTQRTALRTPSTYPLHLAEQMPLSGLAGRSMIGGADGESRGFERRWTLSELHLFLPEEFAPHWLRSPRRSNFLDRVALISSAEVPHLPLSQFKLNRTDWGPLLTERVGPAANCQLQDFRIDC